MFSSFCILLIHSLFAEVKAAGFHSLRIPKKQSFKVTL